MEMSHKKREDPPDDPPQEMDLNNLKGKGSKISMGNINKKKKRNAQKNIGIKKDKNMDNLDYLKKLVQQLCKNTNPLGKSLDFIRDDIENMNREKEQWR